MRARHVSPRPYHSRKEMKARYVLKFQHGITGQGEGRTWCYTQMVELGYRWDSAANKWVAGKHAA